MGNYFQNDGSNTTAFNESRKKKKGSGMQDIDNVQGLAQKNLYVMQFVALVMTGIAVACVLSIAIAHMKERVVPVIVTVNNEGEAHYVGKVDKSYYKHSNIPENAKFFIIKTLIKNMYTISTDAVAQNGYIDLAYSVLQKGAANQLDLFIKEHNPFNDFGENIQSVDIQDPLRQTDNTYICNYTVTRKTSDGYTVAIEDWTMLVNIDYFDSAPETNPLGIFITSFDIKEKR